MERTSNTPTASPLNFVQVVLNGAQHNGQTVTDYDIRFRTADGTKHVFKMNGPDDVNQTAKHYQPAVIAKANEVFEFLKSQAGPIRRKVLEQKFQNGERGGKLNSVFSYLKSTGKLIISDGYYTDDRDKIR